ncbi:MAG: hypothetical protein GY906_38475, partial [bacterium]|nr:hypothetical protein [bacterium]
VLELRGPQHCDLVVVLVHTGLERDTREEEARSSSYENYAWRLAQIPGIDVLLTGHTHDEVAPRLIGDAIVSQPSARARVVTKIDLELERGAAGWRVRSWSGENVDVSVFAASEEFVEHFEERHTRVVAALDGPVGVVEREVSIADCRVRDCAALDLVRAVQLEASGAELSLASLLSNRTPVLPTGPVTWRWVHSLYVYPNTLVKLKLNGRQVREVLEHAARYYDDLICDNDSGCRVVANPRVRDYNIDSMAGVTYRIDPTAVQGSKIWDLRFGGEPVADDRVFTVVCNNYRAAGGGLFPHLDEAEIIWQNSAEMADLIGDYLASHNPWVPSADGNWVVAPRVREQRFTSLGR